MAFTELEQRFGKALPLSTLFAAGSARKLIDALIDFDRQQLRDQMGGLD